MATLRDTLQGAINERLVALRLRFEEAKPRALYTALCMAPLWPLLQAAPSQDIGSVTTALVGVAAGVGGNLLAEQMQRWRDQAEPVSEAEVSAWITTQAQTNTDIRDALDTLLERCNALPTLQKDLSQQQQQRLRRLLRAELRALGNLPRFQAVLKAPGAIAQGQGAAAANAGSQAIAGPVSVGHSIVGPGATQIIQQAAPVPSEKDERRPRQQPWRHGALLSIRVVLRDFVARGLTKQQSLWAYITAELPDTLQGFAVPLHQELLRTGGLLLLDGLDEVPEADQRRLQVKKAVAEFVAVFHKVRVLATSRTYAYQRQDWKLDGFAEAVLAPFSASHIQRFVERWYACVGPWRGLPEAEAEGRAVRLNAIIAHNPRLLELATRPLLLTLMTSLHAWHGGTLPEQREQLYDKAVDLLLNHWENQKTRRRADGTYEVVQPSLIEWLDTDQQAMRRTLNRLAFEAHRDQPALVGTADLPQSTLVNALMAMQQNPAMRPGMLIEYLRDRAGILEPRGVDVYAFPHRTFQEYLAACHLTDFGFDETLPALLRAEPSRWREVTLLAGAKAAHGTTAAAWALAEALCFEEEPALPDAAERAAWGALLAAQVLQETGCLGHVTGRHRAKVERIRMLLRQTLEDNVLLPLDRAQAGEALAAVGDPRFSRDWYYLPDDTQLGFIEIPAGSFRMGSVRGDTMAFDHEYEQHEVELPRYYMARYSVTVAQFRVYVEENKRPWPYKDRQGPENHPVVYVSWDEAVAYCAWLTGQLQARSAHLPADLQAGLRGARWHITLNRFS